MTLVISPEHKNARSLATIAFADSGGSPGPSKIYLKDADNVILVTILLSEPCGVLESGLIRLDQAAALGDQIALDGAAVTGEWVTSDDVEVASGTVSNAAGTGDFKISSAGGTSLYAGGYVILGTTALS